MEQSRQISLMHTGMAFWVHGRIVAFLWRSSLEDKSHSHLLFCDTDILCFARKVKIDN